MKVALFLLVQVLGVHEREPLVMAGEPRLAQVFVSPDGTVYEDPAQLEDATREANADARQRRAAAPAVAAPEPAAEAPKNESVAEDAAGHLDTPVTFHDLLLFPRRGSESAFFRGWAELMASDGETTILQDMDREIAYEPAVPWWPEKLTGGTLVGLTTVAALFLGALAYQADTLKRHAVVNGRPSAKELVGLCCFRFYSGLLMCTWLPFVLAEEGAMLMPMHESMFMGIGKLILACAMVLCPIFGLLNDQTVHPWGRRRAWFIWGIGLLMIGIVGCAWASEQKSPYVYLIATTIWCFGEALAETTTEALVPDLVSVEDYLRAASARGILFMLGGFCGYGAIIVQATVVRANQSVFYMYYLVVIFITAPFVVAYATPNEAEIKAIDDYVARENARGRAEHEPLVGDLREQVPGDQQAVSDIEAAERSKSYFQRCYVECLNASPEFRLTSLATFTLAMSCTGMMFILLIVRDVVGLHDAAQIEYHMAAGSLVLLSSAVLMSLLIGVIGIDSQRQTAVLLVFCVFFTLSEFAIACVIFIPTQHGRLVFLYGVGAVKGAAFGGIYNIMQPVTWEFIPEMWRSGTGSVSRAMSWISVCRSVGVGVGNFIGGFILDFAKTHSAVAMAPEAYPLSGYIGLFIFTGSSSIVTILTILYLFRSQEKPTFDRSAVPAGSASSAQ